MDWELNFQNQNIFLLLAPDVTQYVNLIHSFSIYILVSKFFPAGGYSGVAPLTHNLALPLSKSWKVLPVQHDYQIAYSYSWFTFFYFHGFLKTFPVGGGGLLRRPPVSEFSIYALKVPWKWFYSSASTQYVYKCISFWTQARQSVRLYSVLFNHKIIQTWLFEHFSAHSKLVCQCSKLQLFLSSWWLRFRCIPQ